MNPLQKRDKNGRFLPVDYSELEGKIVKYSMFGKITLCRITGCDPDIGITIQTLDGSYQTCYRGPSSTNGLGTFTKTGHKRVFKAFIKILLTGSYTCEDLERLAEKEHSYGVAGHASAETCAFAQ